MMYSATQSVYFLSFLIFYHYLITFITSKTSTSLSYHFSSLLYDYLTTISEMGCGSSVLPEHAIQYDNTFPERDTKNVKSSESYDSGVGYEMGSKESTSVDDDALPGKWDYCFLFGILIG